MHSDEPNMGEMFQALIDVGNSMVEAMQRLANAATGAETLPDMPDETDVGTTTLKEANDE